MAAMSHLRVLLLGTCCALPCTTLQAEPAPERQAALVRMVRQDCGSCHGMQLTGGLGPALTRDALAGKPLASLAATIVHGRPGTAMPPWRALLLDDDEALWIARQLLDGFPEEARRHTP